MKVTSTRGPMPPPPPRTLTITLSEQEAEDITEWFTGIATSGTVFQLKQKLASELRS